MKLVRLQSQLLSNAVKSPSIARGKLGHSFLMLLRKIVNKQTVSFSTYKSILEAFAAGVDSIDSYWEYNIAYMELYSAGKAHEFAKSAYDSLLSLEGTSVEEVVRFGQAMDLPEGSLEIFEAMAEGDLMILLADRIRLEQKKEFAM